MAAQFSQPPTLRELVERARHYGFTKRSTRVPESGERFVYLKRVRGRTIDLVDLPPNKENERLTRAVAEGLCKKLGIPLEDFGLGP